MKSTSLFFDLDGTLTDPAEGITGCIQYALSQLDLHVPQQNELTRFIGPPLSATFAQLLETEDESRTAQAVALYRERFGTLGLFENSVYPGIPQALAALCAQGRALYVVTSKPHFYARKIIEHFGLGEFFREIYGAEMDGTRTAKTELIAWVLEREKLDSPGVHMIGDRGADMVGAVANKVFGVGVLWGYGSQQELAEAGAQTLLSAPQDLITYAADHGA